jgi:hypothetical protein
MILRTDTLKNTRVVTNAETTRSTAMNTGQMMMKKTMATSEKTATNDGKKRALVSG